MKIVYLDQNHWIRLARESKGNKKSAAPSELFLSTLEAVDSGRIRLPLTASNLYETYKIYRDDRRSDLAFVQSRLSGGWVFLARSQRLRVELSDFIVRSCRLTEQPRTDCWFLSRRFVDAFPQYGDLPSEHAPPGISRLLSEHPEACMFDYMVNADALVRKHAVQSWSAGSAELMQRLARRREKVSRESMAVRKRVYSASLMIDEIEVILETARRAGAHWNTASDIGESTARRMFREVPAYRVETELAVRLESLERPLAENDLRDMQNFCAVVPYADCVIAENTFVNLSRQCGLGKEYDTELATDIQCLMKFVSPGKATTSA